MDHLTQPEPINHNELKRLLQECFEEILDRIPTGEIQKRDTRRRIANRIDRAILNGDDS